MRADHRIAARVQRLREQLVRTAAPEVLAEIRETSVSLAIEQALEFADRGYRPAQALEAAGIPWQGREPSWEDAVWSLAMAWRQRCLISTALRTAVAKTAAFQARLKGVAA